MERKRILIAVKVPQQVQELRTALVSKGYEVKVADDGAAALNLCRDFLPHVMLAEIELPKIDGHHLFRELKSQTSTQSIPFILLSKHRSVEERVHSMNMGVDDYINIPFDVKELLLRFEIILKEIDRFESTSTGVTKGFAGKLSDMNVLEVIQALHIGKKSGLIKVQREDKEGIVFLKDGEIIDAVVQQLDALSAVYRMITWVDGSFRVEIRKIEQPRSLNASTQEIIGDGLIFRDRWQQLTRALPPVLAPIKPGPNVARQNFTEEEKEVLSKIDDHARLIDLVERSQLNDLKALQIAAGLFTRGAIIEKPADEVRQNGAGKDNRGSLSDPARLSNLIVSFIERKAEPPKNGYSDRRKGDRRKTDRRQRGRRGSDIKGENSRLYLNKSELLMIRQKLSENSSNGEDDRYGMLL